MRRPAVVAAALLLPVVPALAAREPPPLTATAAPRDLAATVRVVGRLEAVRSTVVSSGVRGDRGKIVWIVGDGVRVGAGEVLARLDPTPFDQEVSRLEAKLLEQEALVEANVQLAEWEKAQAERDLEKAAFDLKIAQLDRERLERGDGPLELGRLEGLAAEARERLGKLEAYVADLERLAERGWANPAEIENARREAAEAGREHEQARRQHENYRDFVLPALLRKERARVVQAGIDAEQVQKALGFKIGKAMAAVRQARQELEGTRAALAAARAELEGTVIRAPTPGMAVLREDFQGEARGRPRVGDQVWQGQPLIYLPDLSRMEVRALVREVDLSKVAVGEAASVRVDAYPDLRLSGTVTRIGAMAEPAAHGDAGPENFFLVAVALDGEEPRLRPGMTARVEVRHAEARGALAVPAQAIFRERGREVCFVRNGSRFAERTVEVGLRTEDWAQVTAGLSPGDEVALSRPPARLLEGSP